jgi:hypothetical protein
MGSSLVTNGSSFIGSQDQRALVTRLEQANTAEFARLLAHPSRDDEMALRDHLGDARYQRLHARARQLVTSAKERGLWNGRWPHAEAAEPRLGNAVLLPGVMGSALTVIGRDASSGSTVWLDPSRLALGQIDRLNLAARGAGARHGGGGAVRATGILKSYYGDALLALAGHWNVQAFWYDWRTDLDEAADGLRVEIDRWFGPDSPVHLVAHSMGGLVCRSFIRRHADRWKTMWDPYGGQRGGRLVMLGTPNHGSYRMLQTVCGLAATVRTLALVDQRHDLAAILRILNTFAGTFQMLPSPEREPAAEPYYDAATYGDLNVAQSLLDRARQSHRDLAAVIDAERMVYVAGSNQPTLAGLADPKRLRDDAAYLGTTQGDGSVSHALGLLKGVRTYFIEEEHAGLTTNRTVLDALDELLQTGKTNALSGGQTVRAALRNAGTTAWSELGRTALERAQADRAALAGLARQLHRRLAPALPNGADETVPALGVMDRVHPSDSIVADLLTRDLLSPRAAAARLAPQGRRFRPTVTIGLVAGAIDQDEVLGTIDAGCGATAPVVDAIGVGHYPGVRPQAAELALDRAVTARLLNLPAADLTASDLILTQYTERGLLRGDLGTTFFLPFPAETDRLLAVAGLGPVGGCGVPELTVLVRELCWALGCCGRRHLASVLIGSGNGNLSVRQCVESWIRGIKRALDEAHRTQGDRRLRQVTFVELDALKIRAIQAAILDVRQLQESEIDIAFNPLSQDQLQVLEEKGLELKQEHQRQQLEQARQELRRSRSGHGALDRGDRQPTRLTAAMDVDPRSPHRVRYCFAALTEAASIPERSTILNRVIVEQANDELAGESDPSAQLERGQFLGRLLIPQELRPHLSSAAPLVLQLDATTARIHWEMIAQPDPVLPPEEDAAAGTLSPFLGTYRGLTRQLKSQFARPPEPARTLQPVLRVLVVADPAREAPLPGAEEEGLAVAALFEQFNGHAERAGWLQRFEVVCLIGSVAATPSRVLRELSVRRYDVLHFAGHCVYNTESPPDSGWIFSDGVVMSASELQRIDRVPHVVVSNACESGITPDRSDERTVALVPSFAEAFFAQGVANFVGTAWPVDDLAAREFATTLYGALLGLGGESADPLPIHLAMLHARLAVARSPSGRGTWGAYQHYGNPYFRLLAVPSDPTRERPAGTAGSRG